ncbi:uncharacterized protein MEPE_05244 [Melanopsichium pennsylvanicum]|uniref:Uncharacterized protein n=2 Tax=Melanopsichium pennsylvanicum TaxID=63383 RepID=A0AAJ5C746_9BASI|nr:conserved hypothetical protein [Melanopsichium pennsylvanicum 4]SNX86535.1 uncharacterized protein MEPE_05244 [Melanopsichium pennsylvanicum]
MELSVGVHSTDIFLFPSKRQRNQSSSEPSSSSTSSSSATVLPSSSSPSTTSVPSSLYDGSSPAYSEVEDITTFSSSSNKLSNDDHAILYAYVDIRIPFPNSSSSCTPSCIRNRLKSLTLTLTSHENISFPRGGMEANRTFHSEKSLTEALDIEYFEPGKTYRFEQSFFIDHNAAPFQRSNWGINNQQLVAKATFHGLLTKTLTATKKVYFVDCQNDEGNEMIVWDKDVRTHADGIGPFSLRNRSEVFTVGGYLRTNFDLLSPLEGVSVVGIRGFVEQRTRLTSRKERKGYAETVLPKKVQFLKLDRHQVDELFKTKKLEGGGEGISPDGECYPSLQVVSRIPNDNEVRPSTVEGNDAAIRFTNFITYEIDFIDGEYRSSDSKAKSEQELIYIDNQMMKRFHVSIPIFLNSCGCRPDSLNLPSYACEDPMPASCIEERKAELEALHDKQTDPSAFPCICTFTLESLLEVEKKTQGATPSCSPPAEAIEPLPRYKSFESRRQHTNSQRKRTSMS